MTLCLYRSLRKVAFNTQRDNSNLCCRLKTQGWRFRQTTWQYILEFIFICWNNLSLQFKGQKKVAVIDVLFDGVYRIFFRFRGYVIQYIREREMEWAALIALSVSGNYIGSRNWFILESIFNNVIGSRNWLILESIFNNVGEFFLRYDDFEAVFNKFSWILSFTCKWWKQFWISAANESLFGYRCIVGKFLYKVADN